jgi:hypothetical protein
MYISSVHISEEYVFVKKFQSTKFQWLLLGNIKHSAIFVFISGNVRYKFMF